MASCRFRALIRYGMAGVREGIVLGVQLHVGHVGPGVGQDEDGLDQEVEAPDGLVGNLPEDGVGPGQGGLGALLVGDPGGHGGENHRAAQNDAEMAAKRRHCPWPTPSPACSLRKLRDESPFAALVPIGSVFQGSSNFNGLRQNRWARGHVILPSSPYHCLIVSIRSFRCPITSDD